MVGVLDLFDPIKPMLGFDPQRTANWCFSLHTKTTTAAFLICCALVTASTYIGDPIDCVVRDVPPNVMDTYCWIHSTFTLPGRLTDGEASGEEATAAPGVGNRHEGEEVRTHKYYQWVCFTLFFQALCFYAPRWLWGTWEGKKMKAVIPDELCDKPTDPKLRLRPKGRGLLSDEAIEGKVRDMRDHFARYRGGVSSPRALRVYHRRFFFCELLCLLNAALQIFFIDVFLGGMFTSYGGSVLEASNADPADRDDPMNLVFPKVAKCTFHRFGPTGTVERFDGLCVLPINIINEKIYIFLWFWLLCLTVLTVLHLLYRIVTVASRAARKAQLRSRANNLVDNHTVDRITDRCGVGEWFFLCQLGANLDPYVFARLLQEIDKLLLAPATRNGSADKMDKLA